MQVAAQQPYPMAEQNAPKNDVDIYRDTPVRFLGYANELGESFRPIFPALVAPSYALAFSYVFADTHDKYRRSCDEEVKATKTFNYAGWR